MSQKSKKIRVQIVNPLPGCQSSTSLAHARRYIRRGAAKWIHPDRVLQFISGKVQAAAWSAVIRRGEGLGIAKLDQVQGLPVAGPAIRVFTGKRLDKPVYDPSTVELGRLPMPYRDEPKRQPRLCQCANCRKLRPVA